MGKTSSEAPQDPPTNAATLDSMLTLMQHIKRELGGMCSVTVILSPNNIGINSSVLILSVEWVNKIDSVVYRFRQSLSLDMLNETIGSDYLISAFIEDAKRYRGAYLESEGESE